MLSKINRLLVFCALTASTAFGQKAGQSFEPILTSEPTLDIPSLLVLSAIETDARKIADQTEADRLYASTQQGMKGRKDDVNAPGEPLYKDAVALLQFYLMHGHFKNNREKAKTVGQWLEDAAIAYAEVSTKNPDMQARTTYLSKVGKFARTDGTDGISELIPLKDKLKNNRDALANIDLLVGYSLALAPATSAEGVKTMNSVANQVSIYGRLGHKMTEAMLDYGLDSDGSPLNSIKTGAETKLTYCVQIARGMPANMQHIVMNSAVFIWSKANGSKGGRAPSFLRDGFAGVLPVETLREKEALADYNAGKIKDAANAYRKIAGGMLKTEFGLALEQRVWDLELAHYQKYGSLTDLETAFNEFRSRYQGKRGFYSYLVDSYRKTVDSVLDVALANTMSKPLQLTVAQVAARYAKIESDAKVAYAMKFKVAQIYRGLQMYKEAVDLYVELAKVEALKNYLLAIEAQSQLASWPTVPNLGKVPADKNPERKRLLGLYETVNQLKKGEDWFMIAHIGALNRALGQVKAAEILWLKSLRANSTSKLALEATGTLLNEFYATKRWEDVVELSHLMASRKQAPTLGGKALDYKLWLADALFKGGTADLAAKNLPRSVKFLEEFVQVFPKEPRVPQAMNTLAYSYKGMNKLSAALTVSKTLVEKFPTYGLRAKLMVQAGDWAAADRAQWEFAFFFYGKYIQDFANQPNVPQIRLILADLYLKRKLYGWAVRLYKEQSLAPKVPRDQQLAAAVKAMDIEAEFGEAAEANRLSQRVIDLSGPNDPSRLKALGLTGRFAANSKNLEAMAAAEAKLLPYGKNNKDVLESLGLIRFRRAEMQTKAIVYGENNLTIKDPEGVVKKYFDRFISEKKAYQSVCEIGVSTYCAPSLLRLVTVAKQAMEALDKVSIADTLGPSRVNSFKVLKQLHVSKVNDQRKYFINEALRLAKANSTTAIWKEEIMKSLELEQKAGAAH